MSRFFLLFSAFFIGLAALSGLLINTLYFNLGTAAIYLPAYANSYLLLLFFFLVSSLLLLKYYHSKMFWLSLLTGGIYLVTRLCHSILIYKAIVTREPDTAIFFILPFVSVAGILYCLSLIFSNTRKQRWLMTAGICLLTVILVSVCTFAWGTETRSIRTNAIVKMVNEYSSLVGSMIPFLFVFQFMTEAARIKKKAVVHTTRQKLIFTVMSTAGIILVIWIAYSVRNAISENRSMSEKSISATPSALTIAQGFEAKAFVDKKGDTLPYRLLKPLGYDLNKQYPLVVCLHHGGGHGTDNIRHMDGAEPAELLSMESNMLKYPCFVFVPQCPPGFNWGGVPHAPAADSLVFKAIYALEQQYRIDTKRLYVAGVSMGGFGSWHFICDRPEMFAAAMPICGAGDSTIAGRIIDVPVWAFHGEKDGNVPVERSREMIRSMQRAGGHPLYTEFPGAGHNIWSQVNDTAGLLDWLFAQRRQ